jgi:RNA polymerase sigma-B factor
VSPSNAALEPLDDHLLRDPHALGRLSREMRARVTTELLDRAAGETGDERTHLLDLVVIVNQRVADSIAARYRGRGVSDDDLRQTAYEGLVKAVHRFEPAQERDLLSYAVPTIRGEVQRFFRDHSWTVRPPRRVQELQAQVNHTIEALSQASGHEPSPVEVAEHLGISLAEYDEALAAFGCFRTASLDQPLGHDSAATVGEQIPDDEVEHQQDVTDDRVELGRMVRGLSERDRRILYLRFYEDRTQEEIGSDLGVSQMQVSRLLTRILTRLRTDAGVTV